MAPERTARARRYSRRGGCRVRVGAGCDRAARAPRHEGGTRTGSNGSRNSRAVVAEAPLESRRKVARGSTLHRHGRSAAKENSSTGVPSQTIARNGRQRIGSVGRATLVDDVVCQMSALRSCRHNVRRLKCSARQRPASGIALIALDGQAGDFSLGCFEDDFAWAARCPPLRPRTATYPPAISPTTRTRTRRASPGR
jgi:hypothetical protein